MVRDTCRKPVFKAAGSGSKTKTPGFLDLRTVIWIYCNRSLRLCSSLLNSTLLTATGRKATWTFNGTILTDPPL
jgi:hypothetical protein